LQPSSVYFLVFHGSRDARSQQAAKQLTDEFHQRIIHTLQVNQVTGQGLAEPSDRRATVLPRSNHEIASERSTSERSIAPRVQDIYLECTPLPLHQQILQWIEQLALESEQLTAINWQAIPVFLLPGTHVMQDIPAEMTAVQKALKTPLPLTLTPYLGSHPGLRRVLSERLSLHPMEAWVLLAHGSRQAGANQAIEQLAEHIGAITAYWSTEPGLAQQVTELSNLGLRRIGIMPYFLFSGGITDAIAQLVAELNQQLPHLTLTLVPPLEVNRAELADLLVDLGTSSARATSIALPTVTSQDEA